MQLERSPVVVKVVAGQPLGPPRRGHGQVVALGDPDVDGADRRRAGAGGLRTERVAVQVEGVHVVGGRDQGAHHHRIRQVGLDDRCLGVAVGRTAEEQGRVALAIVQGLGPEVE